MAESNKSNALQKLVSTISHTDYKVLGKDITGMKAWYIVRVQSERVDDFLNQISRDSYNLEEYGEIISSGYQNEENPNKFISNKLGDENENGMKYIKIDVRNQSSFLEIDCDFVILKNLDDGDYGPEKAIDEKLNGYISANYKKSPYTTLGTGLIIATNQPVKNIALIGAGEGWNISPFELGIIHKEAIKLISKQNNKIETLLILGHAIGFGLDIFEILKSELYGIKNGILENKLKVDKIVINERYQDYYNKFLEILLELSIKNSDLIKLYNNEFYLRIYDDKGDSASSQFEYLLSKIEELETSIKLLEVRRINNPDDNKLNQIIELISKSDLQSALKLAIGMNFSSLIKNDLYILESRYQYIKRNERLGIMSHEDIILQRNKIAHSLLEILNEQ